MTAPRSDRAGPYTPKMPATWWLQRSTYLRFMLRELSSVFIATFLVVLLLQIRAVARGPEAYVAFLEMLRAPAWIVFHVVALAFALYHSVTWFALTGAVQVVRLGERQVPPRLVVAANFALWVAVSLGVVLGLVRGG